jgi:catechol 2,3-dioxygenase-like lactoylglutathione lyase family enzyme
MRVNVTARENQIEMIDRLARRAGMTRSAYMVQSATSGVASKNGMGPGAEEPVRAQSGLSLPSLNSGTTAPIEENMIDHVILTVSDFKRSVAFYAKALKPLGITTFIDYEGKDGHPDLKGFGDGKRHFFWLKEGKPDPQAVHVGFVAKDHSEVDAFYKAALAAGGKSKESPRARLEYYPGYYATWVLDPDGHDIEVVHKS